MSSRYTIDLAYEKTDLVFVGAENRVERCTEDYLSLIGTIEKEAVEATHAYVEKYKSEHDGQSPRYLTGEGNFKRWRNAFVAGVLDGIEKGEGKL